MSDAEVDLADGDAAQSYDEAYQDVGEGSAMASPSNLDHGLDSIVGVDPQTQHFEEGSNTLHPSEQPDVISSYTGQGTAAQPDDDNAEGYGEQAEEPGDGEDTYPQPDQYADRAPDDQGPGDEPPDTANAETDAYAQENDAEPQEADAELQEADAEQAPDEPADAGPQDPEAAPDPQPDPEPGPAEEESSMGPDAEPSSPGPAPDAGDDDALSPGPDEADPALAEATGQPEEGEAAAGELPTQPELGQEYERPASAAGEPQPAASTSRPGSAVRPGSARPGSARPGSARPGSAGPRRLSAGGSRPNSASLLTLTPESVGIMGQVPHPPGVGVGVGGSRPQSASSRPGSAGGAGSIQAETAYPAGGPAGMPQILAIGVPGGLSPGGVPTIPEDQPLAPVKIERYIAPGLKAIEVEIEQGPGMPHRLVRVLMDLTQCDPKPYLGGFRNKRTGAVYHHAGTQTPRAPKYSEADRKLSRETQTVKVKQHSQQTVREQATQMARPGMELDTTYDRVVTPGRYQTADERDIIVEAATRCMQRWVRGWLGRRRAAYLRKKKAEREAFLREQELAAQKEAEEHRRREIQRRMHPRTAADFEVLYNELEAWRLQETRKIKEAGLPKDQEQQVLQQLLHKETKLLQTIDRLKINANHENKEARIQHTLNEMSKPKKFALRNGGKVDVHTPFTTRAKELQQLYNGLNLPLLTVDERLDVLLHVKWTVKEFDCDLTREVVGLIDREADLLNRGRNPKMLEGLRKRISSLFLNFIETPEFNPEAARFQIVPMDFETYLYEKVGRATAKAGTTLTTRPTMTL